MPNIKNIETLKKYKKFFAWFFGGWLGSIVIIIVLLNLLDTPEAKQQRAKVCRQDIACWSRKHHSDASLYCSAYIEAMAKYDHNWTSIDRYSRVVWQSRQKGTLTFSGNNLKLQNGFGAWGKVHYQCDYDPSTKTARNVSMSE